MANKAARKSEPSEGSKIDRVPTGIPGLDPLIEGGLPKNSATLITGSTGTGKTIFGIQFLVEGARRGEKGVYINFEEDTKELYMQGRQFGWDIPKLEKEGMLKILSFDMTKTHVVNVIIELENTIKQFAPTRLVLDSISILDIYSQVSAGAELSQLLGIHGENMNMSLDTLVERGSIMGILSKMRGFGTTSLIISERPQESQWLSRDTISEFLCDGVIVLTDTGIAGENAITLKVHKMRLCRIDRAFHVFKITSKGASVEKESMDVLLK